MVQLLNTELCVFLEVMSYDFMKFRMSKVFPFVCFVHQTSYYSIIRNCCPFYFSVFKLIDNLKMLFAENKKKPQMTGLIASSSGLMKADDVARKALNGIKSGRFSIPCNLEGHLLALATSGFSPQSSFLMAFLEVYAAGILRIVVLCFQWTWYRSIEKFHAQNRGKHWTN